MAGPDHYIGREPTICRDPVDPAALEHRLEGMTKKLRSGVNGKVREVIQQTISRILVSDDGALRVEARADGSLAKPRGLAIVAGPIPLPVGAPQEYLIGIGSCALPEAKELPGFVKGCPPNNVDIIRALTAAQTRES
jgi:hypothetical protein